MMQDATRVLWNDGGVEGLYGEDGTTEFVSRCERCGRLANMVYRRRGPRGGLRAGYVVACSRACGEEAAATLSPGPRC
jgi:hypothetical protein